MILKLKKTLCLCVALLLGAVFVFPADAHHFSIIARSASALVGQNYSLLVSFTHIFTEAQFNGEMFGQGSDIVSGSLHFADGSSTTLPAFVDHDDPNGNEIAFMQNLDPSDPLYSAGYAAVYAAMTGNDSFISSAALDKSGTVIADAAVDMPMGSGDFNAYSKIILNATRDGFSMTQTAPAGKLEIVPLSDLGDAVVGKELGFQILLDGTPVPDAVIEWADEASEIVIGVEGHENLAELEEVPDADGIFAFTPENDGLQFLGVMVTTPTGYAGSTLIFATQEPHSSDSSSSCNAAGASFLLLLCFAGLPVVKGVLKRKSL